MAVVHTNEYSGEHRFRQSVTEALAEGEYNVDTYTISDRDGKRTVTIRATKDLSATQTHLHFGPAEHPDQV
jgi:hypothetical protein